MIDLFNHLMTGLAHGLAIPTAWWAFSAWRNSRQLVAVYKAQRDHVAAMGMAAVPRSFSPPPRAN